MTLTSEARSGRDVVHPVRSVSFIVFTLRFAEPGGVTVPAGDGRVLELAIGTGRVALPLAARGISVEGVAASAAMVERLRAKPGGDCPASMKRARGSGPG
jgi:hypothetical protein